jgi:putative transposase
VARVPRSSLPDGYFHVFARRVASGDALFRDDEDRKTFLELVDGAKRHAAWVVYAYCLMSTHYHLVLGSTRAALSRGLQQLNGHYARYFNLKYHQFGHVFAGRFSSRAIEDETYLFDVCAYVLLNPVKAGLCERAGDWPWSFDSFASTDR